MTEGTDVDVDVGVGLGDGVDDGVDDEVAVGLGAAVFVGREVGISV